MKNRSLRGVSKSRLAAYAAAGAASAVACANNAEAVIHVFNPGEVFNAAPGANQSASFNLTGSVSFGLLHARSSSGAVGYAKFGIFGGTARAFNGFSVGNFPYVSKLAANVDFTTLPFATKNIGTMAFGAGYSNSQWLSAGQGYIGFEFNTGAGIQYGWVSITVDGAPGNSFTLNSYAYGDVGDVFQTGQTVIPEPGSLALLAVGGAGLLAWRKRRSQAAKAALPA